MGRPGGVGRRAGTVGHREPLAHPRQGRSRAGAEHRSLRLRGEGRHRTGGNVLRRNGHDAHARRGALRLRLPRERLQAHTPGARGHHGRRAAPFAHAAAPAGLRGRRARGRGPRGRVAAQHPRGDLGDPPRETPRSESRGQRGQLLQEPGGRSLRSSAAAGCLARHAALPRPGRRREAGRRMAHRPRGVERPQRRARRRSRAAGAGAREPRRRDGRRSDRLRPADPAVGRRTVRRGDLDRSQYPLDTPAAAGPAPPERERNENMSER